VEERSNGEFLLFICQQTQHASLVVTFWTPCSEALGVLTQNAGDQDDHVTDVASVLFRRSWQPHPREGRGILVKESSRDLQKSFARAGKHSVTVVYFQVDTRQHMESSVTHFEEVEFWKVVDKR